MTDQDKLIRQVRKIIRDFRKSEDGLRENASSRSTGIRNVYKGGYEALGEIETLVAGKR
jgi:hypothetical protein